MVLYCIVFIHLSSSSCSAHQSEALQVRETQREDRVSGDFPLRHFPTAIHPTVPLDSSPRTIPLDSYPCAV